MVRSYTGDFRRPGRVRRAGRAFLAWLQVLALVIGSLVLWPMLVRADEPNELDFFVEPGDSRTLHCEFSGQEAHIEETVFCRMRVGNGGPVDASFFLFTEPDSFRVFRCPDQGRPGIADDFDLETGACAGNVDRVEVLPDDPRFDRFVGFWAFSVTTRPVITRSFPSDHDVTYDERYREICPQATLDAYDGGPARDDFGRMCHLGLIRGISTTRNFTDAGEPAYERQYFLGMTLRDDGTDQTEFRGWELRFDFTVRAKVPADDPCPSARVNGACVPPVFQRT